MLGLNKYEIEISNNKEEVEGHQSEGEGDGNGDSQGNSEGKLKTRTKHTSHKSPKADLAWKIIHNSRPLAKGARHDQTH